MKFKTVLNAFLLLTLSLSVTAGEATWLDDFEAVKQQAKAQGKYIFLNFSGSDWCGWCIKLSSEVLEKEAFKTYASDNLILALADFPRTKQLDAKTSRQNQALANQYGVRGFPTVLILDPDGRLVQKTGYLQGGADVYIKHVRDIITKDKEKK